MIYLASPYSGSPLLMSFRFRCTRDALVEYTRRGEIVYSPIVAWHEASLAHKLPTDAKWWRSHNDAFLRRSDLLRVLELPGVEESAGVLHEIACACVWGIPIERGFEPPPSSTWESLNGRGYGGGVW